MHSPAEGADPGEFPWCRHGHGIPAPEALGQHDTETGDDQQDQDGRGVADRVRGSKPESTTATTVSVVPAAPGRGVVARRHKSSPSDGVGGEPEVDDAPRSRTPVGREPCGLQVGWRWST